ncbi:hypothetical protein LCGC14_1569630 [marine sediment metagenome]|uniref:Uncharacterized protein n=1 Tax=marine sediment metagenome TaxID=412755 RepID=A0A0F9IK64_9ZZZZ
MAARVTAGAVKEVVPTKIADSVVLTNFIDTANLFVDTHLASAGHTDAILAKIELYLAAHYVALTEEQGGLTRSKLGDADESFANIYGQGLKATRFGQQALAIDTTGILNSVAATQLKAEFRVV